MVIRGPSKSALLVIDSASGTYSRPLKLPGTPTRPFDGGHGMVQLGRVGETFTEHYTGQNNMPGPPSGYFIGYAATR